MLQIVRKAQQWRITSLFTSTRRVPQVLSGSLHDFFGNGARAPARSQLLRLGPFPVAAMGDNGFSADYNVYKTRLAVLCEELDEYMLLAADSPHQRIEDEGNFFRVHFNDEEMLVSEKRYPGLSRCAMPRSRSFRAILLDKLIAMSEPGELSEAELFVASGPGQKAGARWCSD